MLLGANHDETSQVPFLDVGSSSVNTAHKAGVPSKWDVYARKYIARWKHDYNI